MSRSRRTDRSRIQILEAADTAFRQSGIAGVSVEEIASRAGLTRKTVYNLFASKEDIALTLIARAEAADAGYRAQMAADENALMLIEQVLIDSSRWCRANPALARLALVPRERPLLDPPGDRPTFQGLVKDLVALGQKQGRIRRDQPAGFIALFVLGVYGQAMLSALPDGVRDGGGDGMEDRSSIEADVRTIIRLATEGLGAPS